MTDRHLEAMYVRFIGTPDQTPRKADREPEQPMGGVLSVESDGQAETPVNSAPVTDDDDETIPFGAGHFSRTSRRDGTGSSGEGRGVEPEDGFEYPREITMGRSFTLPIILPLGTQAAPGFKPGETVVVIRPVEMKSITGSPVSLSPGTTLTLQAVEGDRLKVAAGRVGRVDASAVVRGADADAHFTRLIVDESRNAVALRARGKLRFERGDHDRAIADLTGAWDSPRIARPTRSGDSPGSARRTGTGRRPTSTRRSG